jgi:1-pyrroline-5-carboxylate dehydrogenase
MYDKGYYCEPTFVTDLPYEHRLWQYEMFLPITTIGRVGNMDEAMRIANNVNYGLTAGFYGSLEETEWFFDHIEAGVTYANRPQGATTGAWPGFQPFGGWKGSGASGKNGGGLYYVQLYMHEQIRTLVKHSSNGKPARRASAKRKTVAKKAARAGTRRRGSRKTGRRG